MAPVVGHPAPDFTLASTAGSDVTLWSFRGKANVLVAFFPLAFTSVCTTELCAFTEDYEKFVKTGTAILPVSVDALPSLKEFKAKERIAVELLSDFKREVSRAYGVLDEARFFRPALLLPGGQDRGAALEPRRGEQRPASPGRGVAGRDRETLVRH